MVKCSPGQPGSQDANADEASWLESWLPLLRERLQGLAVLELGCGSGIDTVLLCDAGLRVVALDISPEKLAQARQNVPGATFVAQDLREEFPAGEYGAVLASLSLHYFPWEETVSIMNRVRDALPPGGVLISRFNSVRDIHFGASQGTEMEKNYYEMSDPEKQRFKRFFDRSDIDAVFKEWKILSVKEATTRRFGPLKHLWEVVAEPGERGCGS